MGKVPESIRIYRQSGLQSLLREVVRVLTRPLRNAYYQKWNVRGEITDREVSYNGITVRPYRKRDRFLPLAAPPNKGGHSRPASYETGLCTALRENVQSGDDVVVIGGGLGVTATVAAKEVGEAGAVTCYEGSTKMTEHIHETVTLNGVTDRVSVKNCVVSDVRGVMDENDIASQVQPAEELSRCDILEMDVEGVEEDILEGLTIRPRIIIVETHGNRRLIKERLQDMGYTVDSERIAEIGPYEQPCERNEIYVISAELGDK